MMTPEPLPSGSKESLSRSLQDGYETSKPRIGIWIATALVVGNMVGSGVFLLPASLARFGGISLLGWLFTTAGAVTLALTLSRLGRRFPAVGGPYAYARRGLGDLAGFLVAWGYWISIWSGNAAISVGFVGYLGAFFPALGETPALGAGAALGAIWFLTAVNAYGVREAGLVQLVTTVLKLLPLAAIGTVGLLYLRVDHFVPFNASGESGFSAVTATATLTLWAFLGLESATIPADSVKNPAQTIPRATILGTLAAGGIYILATVGVMGILPASELGGSTAPFADAARLVWGSWAGSLVAIGAVVSAFGALNGWILLQGQMPRAAAIDGLFPQVFGKLTSRGTPALGLIISSVLVTGLLALNYTASLVDQFTFIILLATMSTLLPYAFSALSELILLRRDPDTRKGARLTGVVFLSSVALAYSLWAMTGIGREALVWGTVLLLAGIPIYWLQSRRLERAANRGRLGAQASQRKSLTRPRRRG